MSRQTRNNIKSKNMDLALNKGNVIYTNKRTSIELLDKDNASPPKNSKLNEAITLSHLANNIETTLSLVGEEMPKNQFSKARRALHQNEGIVLTGREKEVKNILPNTPREKNYRIINFSSSSWTAFLMI